MEISYQSQLTRAGIAERQIDALHSRLLVSAVSVIEAAYKLGSSSRTKWTRS